MFRIVPCGFLCGAAAFGVLVSSPLAAAEKFTERNSPPRRHDLLVAPQPQFSAVEAAPRESLAKWATKPLRIAEPPPFVELQAAPDLVERLHVRPKSPLKDFEKKSDDIRTFKSLRAAQQEMLRGRDRSFEEKQRFMVKPAPAMSLRERSGDDELLEKFFPHSTDK